MSPIPDMTDPLGKHWKQPNRLEISVDDNKATMSRAAFNQLAEYSTSCPTGVYEGKMWKRRAEEGWLLCWYEALPNDPNNMKICYRRILLLDT